jgi:hypothetical protein
VLFYGTDRLPGIKFGDMRGEFARFYRRQIPFAGEKIATLQFRRPGIFL